MKNSCNIINPSKVLEFNVFNNLKNSILCLSQKSTINLEENIKLNYCNKDIKLFVFCLSDGKSELMNIIINKIVKISDIIDVSKINYLKLNMIKFEKSLIFEENYMSKLDTSLYLFLNDLPNFSSLKSLEIDLSNINQKRKLEIFVLSKKLSKLN